MARRSSLARRMAAHRRAWVWVHGARQRRWLLRLALAFAVLFIGARPAVAEPLTLPKGEDPSAWAEILAIAGLEIGPPSGGAWVVVQARGDRWSLVVLDRSGHMHEATVPLPTGEAEREAVAWLASSLLRSPPPAPTPTPLASLPPPSGPAPSPAPRPRPPPKIAPAPPPPPLSEAAPLVEPTVGAPEPEPAPFWRGELGGELILAAGRQAGVGVHLGGGLDRRDGRLGAAARLSLIPATQLRGLAGDRWRRDLYGSLGPTLRLGDQHPLRLGPTFGLALRAFGEEGVVAKRLWIPTTGLQGQWSRRVGPALHVSFSGWGAIDLRSTELIIGDAPPDVQGRWSGGIGLALGWSEIHRSRKAM